MDRNKAKSKRRQRRRIGIRKRIRGTAERPRLSVFRSLKHVYCQLIDDLEGKTLLSESTNSSRFSEAGGTSGGNRQASELLGKLIATKAKEQGVTKIVLDRAGYKYHGRIKALAESLRQEGLKF